MNIQPFNAEELEEFWGDAQCEIYDYEHGRDVDMMHACTFGAALRFIATKLTWKGTLLTEFDSQSAIRIIASYFLCESFEKAESTYQP